jgi:PAS domain S-box-containing protein
MPVPEQNRSSPEQTKASFTQEIAHKRFLALAQENADIFWVLTAEGEMSDVGSSWQQFTGYKEQECRGQHWRRAVHPADVSEINQVLRHTITARYPGEATCRIRHTSGAYHSLHLRVIPVQATGDYVQEIIICGSDITRQKPPGSDSDITALRRAEEQARAANQRIETLLESITDAFACLDTEWRYTYVNNRMAEYTGKSQQEIQGQCIWDIFPYFRNTPFEQMCREAMKTQRAIQVEMDLPEWRIWGDIHLYPTRDGLSIYWQDITRRKQVEMALREAEKRFRRFVDSNVIGILITSLDGSIHEANDAFLSLVGYTRADLLSGALNWKTLTPPEWKGQERQAELETFKTGAFQPFEKEYITKDGRRVPVLIGGTLFPWSERPDASSADSLMISFVLDISAQKAIEKQKDLFLSIASHELKTPLAALKGTLQLVERRLKRLLATPENLTPGLSAFILDFSKHLTTAVRQTDLQAHLINDLLDVSRITANTLELSLKRYDLAAVVSETVEDLRVTAPDRLIQLILPAHTAVPVLIDVERISQVITNYITNAIRYSYPGKQVSVGLALEEERARVWVKDQGQGLSKEACREIWQRFHKARDVVVQSGSGKGLGLGLYICQTLVEQHQGQVGVESTPGQGSTFWFTLPLAR